MNNIECMVEVKVDIDDTQSLRSTTGTVIQHHSRIKNIIRTVNGSKCIDKVKYQRNYNNNNNYKSMDCVYYQIENKEYSNERK